MTTSSDVQQPRSPSREFRGRMAAQIGAMSLEAAEAEFSLDRFPALLGRKRRNNIRVWPMT